jgi:hypothetical protein
MWYTKETFANTQKPSEHLGKSHLVSRSAIRVCSNEFTATGTVQFGTQRTQQMVDVGKTAAKQPDHRTGQYGMKWETWNLQGGGRWFESSIAHFEKAAFCR